MFTPSSLSNRCRYQAESSIVCRMHIKCCRSLLSFFFSKQALFWLRTLCSDFDISKSLPVSNYPNFPNQIQATRWYVHLLSIESAACPFFSMKIILLFLPQRIGLNFFFYFKIFLFLYLLSKFLFASPDLVVITGEFLILFYHKFLHLEARMML